MPNFYRPILTAAHNDGLRGVKTCKRDVGRMSLEGLDTRFRLVIPDFDEFIVAGGNEIGFVATVIVVDVVDSLVVGVEGEIGSGGGE